MLLRNHSRVLLDEPDELMTGTDESDESDESDELMTAIDESDERKINTDELKIDADELRHL
jgi:hypothetical protein